MRGAFSLVSLLVVAGIVALLWSQHTAQIATSGSQARQEAEQIAGVDSTLGGRVSDHLTLECYSRGSQLESLHVTKITPGSAYQTYYGIQNGDYIDIVGPQPVKDIVDGEMAKALAMEAYQRQWELGVWRNGKHYTFPAQKALAAQAAGAAQPAGTPNAAATPAQPAAQPAAPAQPQQPNVSPLQRQLDQITSQGK